MAPPITMERQLPASPAHVWATVSDPTTYEHWHALHSAWVEAPQGAIEVGTRMVEKVKIANITDTIDFRVETYCPPSDLVLSGSGSTGSKVSLRLSCAPNGEGSTITIALDVSSPLLFGPIGKAIQKTFKKQLTATLDGMAKYLDD
ncbi:MULTISPECIES: SRPBCC family protein [Rhodococcus]|uniref:SRPBCC family protein n=1 Tax=Rhodococcus oxybenzonivorans TaxID=1990687 RepID=A0AAE5A520_9NOCA|nr:MULTISPECIES: SRPBCC family protein [Rhodococcus]MDV7244327.1 SRPBCC family protein [Rhodococcus oxybenzonivorans]MDV7263513.1 SRPBCC family protein [Rhodococcus oxybenzonivorans]MDV7274430.1 SRPBCC family protein [Rhodococcus oxybenzonivorans]MDV7335743.1 SRPBCC family protein [Rhodococcus oxybenzonivorans]MDV7345380.1 SRPBCC family protein [Rhodococcus oxybenzonivorans]